MRKAITFGLLSILLILPAAVSQAQETAISVALPDFFRNLGVEDIFDGFEAANPGVRVNPVYTPMDQIYPLPADDLDEHLEAIQALVSAGDVVLVTNDSLSVEATRAGYFLDLTPLAGTDASLNTGDFVPAAWQSFQWDNALWGLPASIDVVTLLYNPAAFDAAGLPYPNEAWTIEDLANAARTLTERDSSGSITMPGLITSGNSWLLRALYGRAMYDETTMPHTPNLDDPALEALLTRLMELEEEGIFASYPANGGDLNNAPMRIVGSYGLSGLIMPGQEAQPVAGSLLPGGVAAISTTGFAVSSGTTQPDLAYRLAKYLTENVELINFLFGARPARNSLVSTEVQPSTDGGMVIQRADIPAEHQAFVDDAFTRALSGSELRYSDYINNALVDMQQNGTDARTALGSAELEAINNLQAAADRRGVTPILVATPAPEVAMNPGEITLNFGLPGVTSLPQWDALAREFAAADPQVGQVSLNTQFNSPDVTAEQNDCFYTGYNAIPSMDITKLLNLDPFIDADPSFDRNDVVGGVLSQLQRDNRTYGYPLALQPSVMNYNNDLFTGAGLPAPTNGWTFSDFVNALQTLQPTLENGRHAFNNRGFGNTALLMLIAAAGLPFDYRTSPPTINFTDPATVDAIRQVLDLAKDDLINYSELATNVFTVSIGGEQEDPIYTDSLGGSVMMFGGSAAAETDNPYRMTTYPAGTSYNVATYDISAAYISATAQNPDACYRWLRFLAEHPELFDTMPARRSQFTSPALLASEGEDAANFYSRFDALIQDPNTIVFPSQFSGSASMAGTFILNHWLNRSFDAYVLHDGDLAAELAEAQTYAEAFQACTSSIPPYDPATTDMVQYVQQFETCATSVDPETASMFRMGS